MGLRYSHAAAISIQRSMLILVAIGINRFLKVSEFLISELRGSNWIVQGLAWSEMCMHSLAGKRSSFAVAICRLRKLQLTLLIISVSIW